MTSSESGRGWPSQVIDLSEVRRRRSGSQHAGRTVFLAFDCPCCGKDVFTEVPVATPRRKAPPSQNGRDYLVTCPSCRQVLQVRDKGGPPAHPR